MNIIILYKTYIFILTFALQAYQTFEYNGMVQANTPEESPYVLPNDFQTLENWVTYRDTDYL